MQGRSSLSALRCGANHRAAEGRAGGPCASQFRMFDQRLILFRKLFVDRGHVRATGLFCPVTLVARPATVISDICFRHCPDPESVFQQRVFFDSKSLFCKRITNTPRASESRGAANRPQRGAPTDRPL